MDRNVANQKLSLTCLWALSGKDWVFFIDFVPVKVSTLYVSKTIRRDNKHFKQ